MCISLRLAQRPVHEFNVQLFGAALLLQLPKLNFKQGRSELLIDMLVLKFHANQWQHRLRSSWECYQLSLLQEEWKRLFVRVCLSLD